MRDDPRTMRTLRPGRPRLVLQFAVLTTVGLTVAAGVIVALVRHASVAEGQQRAVARARVTTELVLDGRLRASDVALPVAAPRRHQLDRLFTTRVLRDGIVAAALYGPRGARTYAAGKGAVTTRAARVDVRAALDGRVV